MNVRALDRISDLAIDIFLWTFRVAIIVVVVLGSRLTLLSGVYTTSDWFEFVGSGLTLGSIYAMIALGYTMVYGILRMINFAHGEIFMGGSFGGYFAAVALAQAGILGSNVISSLIAIVIVILVAAATSVALALGVERVAYRPLAQRPDPRPADQRDRGIPLPAVHLPRLLRLRDLRLPDRCRSCQSRSPSRWSTCAGWTSWSSAPRS